MHCTSGLIKEELAKLILALKTKQDQLDLVGAERAKRTMAKHQAASTSLESSLGRPSSSPSPLPKRARTDPMTKFVLHGLNYILGVNSRVNCGCQLHCQIF